MLNVQGIGGCLLAALVLLIPSSAPADDAAWSELKQKHFLVYYAGSRAFAAKVGRAAERYYDRIANDLGLTRHDNFWLWDRRAKIYIYRTRSDFLHATGAPRWAAGKADYVSRRIVTYEGSPTFLKSVLPHEMTHLIFMEFIGFDRNVPLWLNEGVAQWQDELRRGPALRLARLLHGRDALLPLPALFPVSTLDDERGPRALAFYAQSVSLVAFLIEEYGAARFRRFCGALRDGKPVGEALQFTYPAGLRTIDALETKWQEYLEEGQ